MALYGISLGAIQRAVKASGNNKDVARILYGDIGISVPSNTAKVDGPLGTYHHNAVVEGANAPETIADTESADGR